MPTLEQVLDQTPEWRLVPSSPGGPSRFGSRHQPVGPQLASQGPASLVEHVTKATFTLAHWLPPVPINLQSSSP